MPDLGGRAASPARRGLLGRARAALSSNCRHCLARSAARAAPCSAGAPGRQWRLTVAPEVAAALWDLRPTPCAKPRSDSPEASRSRPTPAMSANVFKSRRFDYMRSAMAAISSIERPAPPRARSAASRLRRNIGHSARRAARRSISADGSRAITASRPMRDRRRGGRGENGGGKPVDHQAGGEHAPRGIGERAG